MEEQAAIQALLNRVQQPGFSVKENTIIAVNQAAHAMLLEEGTGLSPLLLTGMEEYETFREGTLYLQLCICGQNHGATVVKMGDTDLFLLDPVDETEEFRSLSLASMELRRPLMNVISSAEHLMADQDLADPHAAANAAKLNRGLMQLMRLICNMSDVPRYKQFSRMEIRDICSFLMELFEKAKTMTADTGIHFSYDIPRELIFTLMDPEQLERAVWNLISNALKFTPKDGTIHAKVTRRNRRLFLSITDSGSGIAENIRSTLFSRYQRIPDIEDSRFGMGLGMVIVRTAAANHGGAVLVDQPEGAGTRITMTITIEQRKDASLHSPLLYPDYSSGWDHALLELADCLSPDAYIDLL